MSDVKDDGRCWLCSADHSYKREEFGGAVLCRDCWHTRTAQELFPDANALRTELAEARAENERLRAALERLMDAVRVGNSYDVTLGMNAGRAALARPTGGPDAP